MEELNYGYKIQIFQAQIKANDELIETLKKEIATNERIIKTSRELNRVYADTIEHLKNDLSDLPTKVASDSNDRH